MFSQLGDKKNMARVRDDFAKILNGILVEAIGALYRQLVRIIRPSWWRDAIKNRMILFSRKGLYAINVQCIVDHRRLVSYAFYSHQGGSRDSSYL